MVVVRGAEVLRAEQTKHAARGDGRHVAALMIEPSRVSLFGNAVADKNGSRRAQRDELVRVHRNVARIPAAEGCGGGAVLQEIAGHPMVFAGAGQVLDRFAPIAPMELGAAFA